MDLENSRRSYRGMGWSREVMGHDNYTKLDSMYVSLSDEFKALEDSAACIKHLSASGDALSNGASHGMFSFCGFLSSFPIFGKYLKRKDPGFALLQAASGLHGRIKKHTEQAYGLMEKKGLGADYDLKAKSLLNDYRALEDRISNFCIRHGIGDGAGDSTGDGIGDGFHTEKSPDAENNCFPEKISASDDCCIFEESSNSKNYQALHGSSGTGKRFFSELAPVGVLAAYFILNSCIMAHVPKLHLNVYFPDKQIEKAEAGLLHEKEKEKKEISEKSPDPDSLKDEFILGSAGNVDGIAGEPGFSYDCREQRHRKAAGAAELEEMVEFDFSKSPSRGILKILDGTPYATEMLFIRGREPGGLAFITAPHGDEPGAIMAAKYIASLERIVKGDIIVLAEANRVANMKMVRYTQSDFNREFGPESSRNSIGRIADTVKKVIWQYRPDVVLNLHEGSGFNRNSSTSYGNTIVSDKASDSAIISEVIGAIRPYLYDDIEHFSMMHKPMPSTLTYFSALNGAFAVGIETSKNGREPKIRMYKQLFICNAILKMFDIGLGLDPSYLAGHFSQPQIAVPVAENKGGYKSEQTGRKHQAGSKTSGAKAAYKKAQPEKAKSSKAEAAQGKGGSSGASGSGTYAVIPQVPGKKEAPPVLKIIMSSEDAVR